MFDAEQMSNDAAILQLERLKERYADKPGEALSLAIKSLSEPKVVVFTENQAIRWTDKVSMLDNGDILGFNGELLGHIDFSLPYKEATDEQV